MDNVSSIRKQLIEKFKQEDFVIDKSGVKVVEIIGATFLVDEESIFGTVNRDYVQREETWYNSQSLNVNDIPPPIPAIWKHVADKDGFINSNYGYLIYSEENHNQYDNVLTELKVNPFSRRAQMIYTRPSIWNEFNLNGRSDFICTDSVQYFIRDSKLIAHVRMRSGDAWAGYRNDLQWQKHVHEKLATDLNIATGDIIWSVGSLHVYERQFYLLMNFIETGDIHISKEDYLLKCND